MPPAMPPERSFVGNVNVVLMTYALDGALAFAAGVMVARLLGPGGRGAYGLFVVSAALAQTVLGLGLGNAAVYFINKRQMRPHDVVGATHVVVIAAAALVTLALAVVVPVAGRDVLGAGVSPWLLAAAVPVLIYATILRVVLQAESRFIEMGAATLVQPLSLLALVGVAAALGSPRTSLIVGIWIASNAASALFSAWRLGAGVLALGAMARPPFGSVRRLATFGVQGETGNVLQLLNYRLDQYLVRAFVSIAGVGIYAVGVSMTEAVWLIANAVAIVLLPRLAGADEDDVRRMTPLAARTTLVVVAAGAGALALVAPVIVPAFFGHAYDESVHALWFLLPGTVALSGSKVITSYIFSQGRPLVNTGITLVSLAVTLVALLLLVPPYGVHGAAAASSLAYIAHFGAALVAYRRISGENPLTAVVPQRADFRLYGDAARDVLARAGIGRPAHARG